MADPLVTDSSLSTIQTEGTPDVTPAVSRQSSRSANTGVSTSRRPSKVMFTSTPKSERGTSSDQLRKDSGTLSDRYPSTLCTDDLAPWDSLPTGYLTSSSSRELSSKQSQESGIVSTRDATPASSGLYTRSPESSRDSLKGTIPSETALKSQSSQQSCDNQAPSETASSRPSRLTSQEKYYEGETTLIKDTPSASSKLFSYPSRHSTPVQSHQRAYKPHVDTPAVSPCQSYESSAEPLGSSRSTSRTSTRESLSLPGARHKATMTRGSDRTSTESSGSADDSEILRRLTKINERMCHENDLLRKQLKLFKHNAELKQISLISLVIAWHQGLLSSDDCQSISELSQLCSEDDGSTVSVAGRRLSRCLKELSSLRPPRDAVTHRRSPVSSDPDSSSPRNSVTNRRSPAPSDPDSPTRKDALTHRRSRAQPSGPDPVWLESSVREIKRVLHHLERTLIDLDTTVRDHKCLWRDMRKRGDLPLPVEDAPSPRLYIPRPHAEQASTTVQFEDKLATPTKPDDSGLGGSFSERGSFTEEHKMGRKARRTSEAHDVREARLLGELCHQLEQRVLVSVFPRQRIDPASFSLRTIEDLIRLEHDPDEKEFLSRKLGRVLATLRLYGFELQRHPFFMTDIMLRFGKFGTDWDKYNFVHQKGYHDPELLRETVGRLVPDPFRYDMLVVLDCLLAMARDDGCSIFLW